MNLFITRKSYEDEIGYALFFLSSISDLYSINYVIVLFLLQKLLFNSCDKIDLSWSIIYVYDLFS